jgi:hypothetical protein
VALLGRGDSLEDEVIYNKGMLVYPSGMIVAKSLLVADILHHSSVSYLLKHVNVRLVLFLNSLLIIEVDAWGVVGGP